MTEDCPQADPRDSVWRTPRLVPLTAVGEAASGLSTFLVETATQSTIYVALPF